MQRWATRADAREAAAGNSVRAGRVALLAALVVWAFQVAGGSPLLAQSQPKPTVIVASVVQAESAASSALPIQVSPANLIPRQAFLRIRGLPPTFALSEGHSIAVGAWAVPLAALPRLRVEVPTGSVGRAEITILLVSIDGTVLDEARATLSIVPREREQASAVPPASAPPASPPRMQPERPPVPLAKAPQLAPSDRDRALKMLQRGNELIATKDFSAAQHFYKRAAEIGLPEAALALARTFDPAELARLGAIGLRPEPEVARAWYEKARALGSTEADAFLLRLSAR